jgi:radical SAM protein with 4Fe4S-binding SPASM domain
MGANAHNAARLARLAGSELDSLIREESYLYLGIDRTKPVRVQAQINERCNYRCLSCTFWRLPHYNEELTIEQWQNALRSLKDFIGRYAITFLGGEPFLKPGFMQLLEFGHEEGLGCGIVTNGSLLRGETIRRLVAAQPIFLDISVDGPTPGTHDKSRGVPGSLAAIERAIGALREASAKQGTRLAIRIKTVLHALNYHSMPDMATWTVRVGAACVDINPVNRWSPETYSDLWIGPDRMAELSAVVAELIQQRRTGLPIVTSEDQLKTIPDHFLGRKISPPTGRCHAGLRNYFIGPSGDVMVCSDFAPIGNVREQDARAIWQGDEARLRRQQTVECKRGCPVGCYTKRPIAQMIQRGAVLAARTSVDSGV